MMIGTWLWRRSWPADFDPVELGQHQVEDDEVEARLGEALQRFAAVERRGDVVAVLAQRVAEQGLHRLLVVDEQYPRGPVGHRGRVVPQARMPTWTDVRVPRTKVAGYRADMKLMTQQRHLKSLIEDGRYQPQPELVAEAMLRRRSVRALLTGAAISPAGRIPSAPAVRRQAA